MRRRLIRANLLLIVSNQISVDSFYVELRYEIDRKAHIINF